MQTARGALAVIAATLSLGCAGAEPPTSGWRALHGITGLAVG